MKKIFYLTLICFNALFTKHVFGQDSSIVKYKLYFNAALKKWAGSFNDFDISSFTQESISSFENLPFMNIADTITFYPVYKSALAFSKDKKQFVDIYSYWLNLSREGKTIISRGGEADQAVSLCNLRTKKWVRIFFRGTTERIQDVTWLSNEKFLLVGVRENEAGKQGPVIYMGNTKTKKFILFTTKNDKIVQNERGYDSPKLLALHIQER